MNSFEEHINGPKPVVVDFYAVWCGPCKMMTPVLKEVKERIGESATILKMDIDKNPDYVRLYNIQAVPTLIIFRGGKILWRKNGVTSSREILELLNQYVH